MSQSKHTPGPWKVGQRIDNPGQIDLIRVGVPSEEPGYVEYSVASVHCYGESAEANAALIASAPDLLNALKRLLGHVPGYPVVDPDDSEAAAIDQAIEAIAKAEPA